MKIRAKSRHCFLNPAGDADRYETEPSTQKWRWRDNVIDG